MSLKEVLVARFGPLMTYADMAALFGLGGAVAADAMRQRMRRDKALGSQLRSCSVRLGRKTYFRADLVAAAIGELTHAGSQQGRQLGRVPSNADQQASNAETQLPASPQGDAQ
jgi:hypothetical protein